MTAPQNCSSGSAELLTALESIISDNVYVDDGGVAGISSAAEVILERLGAVGVAQTAGSEDVEFHALIARTINERDELRAKVAELTNTAQAPTVARWLERARQTQCCDPVIDGLLGQAIEIIASAQAQPQAALADAAIHVLNTFRKDEADGYRSKDRQFAISIIEAALSAAPQPTSIAYAGREPGWIDQNHQIDRYGLALMMIREGCADPSGLARRILSEFGGTAA